MADTRSRWYDEEIFELILRPFEELESFAVSCEFEFFIFSPGIFNSGVVDDDGVVDDHFSGDDGVDSLGVFSEFFHCVSHCGKVDCGGDSTENL